MALHPVLATRSHVPRARGSVSREWKCRSANRERKLSAMLPALSRTTQCNRSTSRSLPLPGPALDFPHGFRPSSSCSLHRSRNLETIVLSPSRKRSHPSQKLVCRPAARRHCTPCLAVKIRQTRMAGNRCRTFKQKPRLAQLHSTCVP